MRTLLLAIAAVVATPAAAAIDGTVTTTVNSTPSFATFNYGAGNNYVPGNAVVTTATANGVTTGQQAVRFHTSGDSALSSSDNGTYGFALGTSNISFDFSLFGTPSATINLLNVLTGQSASFSTLALPDNALSGGSLSNSEQLRFGFLNGAFLPFGNLGFNPNVNNTYQLTLTGANGLQTTAFAQVGTGAVAAVPEPATWALMLLGFGGMGIAMRRQRSGRATLAQMA